jgi:hypothetical protein
LTAVTVKGNVMEVLSCPSLTTTVICATPVWFAAGVSVTVRVAPLPPNTRLAGGTRVGFDDVPLTVKLPAAVSASPTVKASAPVAVSSAVTCAAIGEIVGAVFGGVTVT